ncbi:hypothetical protein QBC40DRAFT_345955 [Triangularia verruculosa]|uniref:PiggyBac transposable element-derived protein domain-containing protein n=1 Tax=Triangularia verruculosa TaxID=2587418 RepID=A0AAN6XUC8_9PEZI|nr:hypothetical protein QBC40DRAFT_345955 [Triangularia verruculosa]
MMAIMVYSGLHHKTNIESCWNEDGSRPLHPIRHWVPLDRYRSTPTVLLRNKEIPRGFEIRAIAEGGYFLNWLYYSGRDKLIGVQQFVTLPNAIAPYLTRELSPGASRWQLRGTSCSFDNYFSTLNMAKALRLYRVAATGMTAGNKICPEFKAMKNVNDRPDLTAAATSHCCNGAPRLKFVRPPPLPRPPYGPLLQRVLWVTVANLFIMWRETRSRPQFQTTKRTFHRLPRSVDPGDPWPCWWWSASHPPFEETGLDAFSWGIWWR